MDRENLMIQGDGQVKRTEVLRVRKRAKSSAKIVSLALDRSTDSSPIITGGKPESMCTDARGG